MRVIYFLDKVADDDPDRHGRRGRNGVVAVRSRSACLTATPFEAAAEQSVASSPAAVESLDPVSDS